MQCVILAAGKGTRLRPKTYKTPKPLLKIAPQKTIIDRTFEQLPAQVTEIIFVVKHLRKKIIERYGKAAAGRKVSYLVQKKLDGTAGALLCCKDFLKDEYLLLHGDDLYSREDLEKLLPHRLALLVVKKRGIPTGGEVQVDKKGKLKGIADYPGVKLGAYFLNTGAYKLNKTFFDYQPVLVKKGSKEYGLPQTLAVMAKDYPVAVEEATRYFQINTEADLKLARAKMKKGEL